MFADINISSNFTTEPSSSLKKKKDNTIKPPIQNELAEIFANRLGKWASEIIPGKLWLGSGTDASKFDELEKRQIRHVLNVADDVPNYHEHGVTYLNLGVQDFGQDAGISRVFDNAFAFLREAEANNEPVLVHCAAGANRSATIVIAYLMNSRHLTLIESWKEVKSQRRGIVPLKDNRLELLEFEMKLFGKSSINQEQFLRL